MKKNISKHKKYKFLILILTLIFIKILINFLDTEFKIINHTLYPIAYNNYEILKRSGDYDFTSSEYKSYRTYYTIERDNAVITNVYRKYWINHEPLIVGINVRYHSKYLTDDNINDLEGTSFRQYPNFKDQKAYCSYQIDVYPNRKTIITPTNKKFCIKPLYLYMAE